MPNLTQDERSDFYAERRRKKNSFVKSVFAERVKEQEERVKVAGKEHDEMLRRNRSLRALIYDREAMLRKQTDPYIINMYRTQIKEIWDEIGRDQTERLLREETKEMQRYQALQTGKWSKIFDEVRYGRM